MKYYMKTETGKTGVGTRDAATSEFSNLKTGTLETGITGGFSRQTSKIFNNNRLNIIYKVQLKIPEKDNKPYYLFCEFNIEVWKF
jgi:hypothetical protein